MVRGDDRALGVRERRDADGRCHRFVQMDEIELLPARIRLDASDRARREHDVRQRAVRRHDDRAADRDDSLGQRRVPPRSRVEESREPAGRIVAHEDLNIVAAPPERIGLMLAVFDDTAPVRPRERDDDPDLHAATAANAACSRSAPAAIVSSLTASEMRAQPAPLGPNPSPGATATRCSVSSVSAVIPSGSRSQTKNVPSQTGGSGRTAAIASRRRAYASTRSRPSPPALERGDGCCLEWRRRCRRGNGR